TRKGEGNVKYIQQDQDKLCVEDQGKAGCKSRQKVYKAHEDTHDRQSDGTCQKACVQRLLSELRSDHLRTDLFQLHIESSDTDRRCKIFRFLIRSHSGDLCLSVLDHIIYIRHADQLAVIIDCGGLVVLICFLGRCSKCRGSFVVQLQADRIPG